MVFLSVRRFNKNGQAVIETLLMLAFGIFILTALTSIVYDNMYSSFTSTQQKQGYAVVQSLSKEINDAYFLVSWALAEETSKAATSQSAMKDG